MDYPTATEDVNPFYDQSERLVRFLAAKDKPSFLALLDALARHQPFETSVLRYYSGKFFSLAALEEQFRSYAAGTLKDAGETDESE